MSFGLSRAICLDEGDQGRADPAVEPVLEAAPPAAALAADVLPTEVPPPTEPVLVDEEPTGADLGMPQEPPTIPGSSNAEFSIQRLPEEQVGAAKGAMVQAELMAGEAKRAYDSIAALYQRSLELRDDIRVSGLVSIYFSLVTHWVVLNNSCLLQWVHSE